MKKSLITLLGILALFMSSCTSVKMTSNTLDVPTSIYATSKADLVVDDERFYFTYRPDRAVWRAGVKNSIQAAIAEALKEKKADVLVSMNYEVKIKRWFFGQKCVKYVTVSGHPGYYKNIRPADPMDFNRIMDDGNGKSGKKKKNKK